MPWGWECRARLVKQVPAKPTDPRGKDTRNIPTPGPNHYEALQIFCGNGYDKIKRAPAYTFGHLTKFNYTKPVTTPKAPMFHVQGIGRKGVFKITHGVMTPQIDPVVDRTKTPGPAAYTPAAKIRYKRPPAYTMRPAARPPYEPWDMWTPPANMYWPQIPGKKEPAFTLGYMARDNKVTTMPGPGDHDPNFTYVQRNKPSYSFGVPFRRLKPPRTPPPNRYCEKKFMVTKPTVPAPSFGIRHSRYIGQQQAYLKSSKVDLALTSA